MPNYHANVRKAIVFTALEVEYNAARVHLSDLQEEVHRGSIYERGTFFTNEEEWTVIITQIGAGNTGAAMEAERAIGHFNPNVALFMGVAGGLKDVTIGDVVAADKVYHYESGKDGPRFLVRPAVGNCTYQMEQRARAEARKGIWLKRIKYPQFTSAPHAYVAPIAAGEKVIASTRSSTYQFLKASYENALAVEMEGYGFLRAAHANQQVSVLVVRGISDLVDGKQKADAANSQVVASVHASAFAFEVLANLKEDELPSRVSVEDDLAKGKARLKLGCEALSHGSYSTAKQFLEEAMHLLQEDRLIEDSAQVRYLLALVYLDGKRPHAATPDTMQRIEELMQAAIQLHPSFSYLYSFAIFKQDFARNGWRQQRYSREAQELKSRASGTSLSVKDGENLDLLRHCQQRLVQDAEQWW